MLLLASLGLPPKAQPASDFSVFGVEMSLTEEGDTRVEEIIAHLFEYLALLR